MSSIDEMQAAELILREHAIALHRLADPESEDEDEDLLDAEAKNEELYPMIPWVDSTESDFASRWVDYHDRGPRDVVLSGPVTGGWGPGRWMKNRRAAYAFCLEKYGKDRVKTHRQSSGRWAFLIKNLRSE